MKKHILTIIFLTATTLSFAQKVNFGLKIGINLAEQHTNSDVFALKPKLLNGYHLGGIVDISQDNLSIQPGLFLTTKGERFTDKLVDGNGNDAGSTSSKYTLTYLELPVNILYKTALAPDAELHLGGGPYLGYGLTAKLTRDGVDYRGSFGNNPTDYVYYKNPDYGVNFLIGATLQNTFIVDVQYSLGLANVTYGGNLQNRVLGLSVGYLFK